MFEEERKRMVDLQLAKRGIIDERVLDAMGKIYRHEFVSSTERAYAYEDRPIHIEFGQTISQPFMVALMTQTLDLKGEERILEIGTGSGYQSAILATLGKEVFTIERVPKLKEHAENILQYLEYDNIFFRAGDGTLGWAEHAPFDRVMVTAAAPVVPPSLFEQLAGGGRMVIPVGSRITQELCLVIKREDGSRQIMHRGGCVFVPLLGDEGWGND